ncbi:DNA-binding response regulator [Pseudonocardia sulfidoxydans NBRC 16205]|uniref:DNA-binding response regulator n=1 Tax=Pseudonocardia sulfidoxydans NBRC 16205 TaxID=1223511 RepID=A0A511DNH3_9PSEU|nr:response regulator transcription factor [Pseudonocardia sulfidoxydans]GEL26366.1 DNA-binding response regulator [Pseudonocardia sulfidoxydans NBRC 16205]
MTAPIRLVLADDESLTRGAVGALLGLEGDLQVVAEASTGDEAVDAIRDHAPDVAVLDVEMPGRDGAEVAQWVAENQPATRCIILTRHARPGVLRRALAAGARGFVTKSAPATVLADVVRRVHGGGRYVDPDLAMTALTSEECPLTDRELEVLRNVDDTGTAVDIAGRVHLSPGTVRNYLSSAMQKLGAGSRSEAARVARDHGWL